MEGIASNNNQVFWGKGCNSAVIANSTLVVNGGAWARAVESNRNTNIIGTQIILKNMPPGSDIGAVDFDASLGNTTKIATSLIQGAIPNLTNVKLFNNYDQDFNPIANQ